MNIEQIFSHTLRALDGSPKMSAATEPRPRVGIAQEGSSSPRADLRTAEVSDLRLNPAYERFVSELYTLLSDDRVDEAYDLVRAEHRAIHGPR